MSLEFDRYSDTSASPGEQESESTDALGDGLQRAGSILDYSSSIASLSGFCKKAQAYLPKFELFESKRTGVRREETQPLVESANASVSRVPAVGKPVPPQSNATSDLSVKQQLNKEQRGDENLRSDSLKRLADKNFARLDSDGDGFISKSELDVAMVNPAFKGEDAQLIGALKRHREALQQLSDDEWGPENDGITRKDIEEFSKLLSKSNKSDSETNLVGDIDRDLYRSGQSLESANHELFADKANPVASVSPEAVKQGRIGDCYLMAAMAAVASTREGKQSIVNMIKKNADGTYTVTFPGAADKPVTVAAPTDAELGLYAQGSPYGTWPAVLEKAYGKYCNENNVDPHDGIRRGAISAVGLTLLTGRDVDTDLLVLTSKEETHRKLSEAMWHGRPVTAATRAEIGKLFGLADGLTDGAGIPAGHLYTIESYDPATKCVTIRNPWGFGEPMNADGTAKDGKDDGVFTMTLDEFYANFMRVSYVE